MAREAALPEVEKDQIKIVDAMIKQELSNMMAIAKIKAKKKKGKKKSKKGKKKKKKGLKLPGYKYIKDKSEYECLLELI